MSLLAYGINHCTASIALRERLSFSACELPEALQSLTRQCTSEAVILSTCNRTEIYTHADAAHGISAWLSEKKFLAEGELAAHSYLYQEVDAVRHIMRVASGLDSMILGEPQVFGQIKQAYHIAENAGTIGCVLKNLFPAVFSTAKLVRNKTSIGAHAISLAYAITQLSHSVFEHLNDCRVLLIGAGETIELIATHFHGMGIKKIIIANRTLEKSDYIVDAVKAHAIRMQDIPAYLKETDIVISATGSPLPILGKGLIEKGTQQKKNNLLLIDLAVPRDIEPEVATLKNVRLYNIDDLQTIIASNLQDRQTAAKQAEMMIECEANQFFRHMRIYHARQVIAEYRERLDQIRMSEQEKALAQLLRGDDPKIILEQFGRDLINKIMHHPTVKLREAASESECEVFQRIKTFFELE